MRDIFLLFLAPEKAFSSGAYLSLPVQVTMDILGNFFHSDSCDIHLNHGNLLEAIWCWTGIKSEYRIKVAEVWYSNIYITCGVDIMQSHLLKLFLLFNEASLFDG